MKVLQLGRAGEPDDRLILHPQVTVVRGLDAARRTWLVDALAGLPEGRADGLAGEVEAQGVRFDLTAETLALLDLHAPLDVVVRAQDLPGYDAAQGGAAAALRRAEAERERHLQRLHRSRAAAAAAATTHAVLAEALDRLRDGGGVDPEAVQAAAAERARLELELDARRAERVRREQEAAVAAAAAGAVHAALAQAEQRAHAAREHRQRALEAATLAAAQLEAARSGVDEGAEADLAQARRRVEEAEQLAAATGVDSVAPAVDAVAPAAAPTAPRNGARAAAAGATPPSAADLAAHIGRLEQRQIDLARHRVAVGESVDVARVQARLDLIGSSAAAEDAPDGSHPAAVVAGSDVIGVPAATAASALALADEWRDVHQQLAALEVRDPGVAQLARARVEAARASASSLASDLGGAPLSGDSVGAVEAAHARVLDAEERADGRFGGGRARKRLDEAKAEERQLLESLGFTTYADYLMKSSSGGLGAADQGIVDTARAGVAAAEATLDDDAVESAEVAAKRAELLGRRDAAVPGIVALLGRPPEDDRVEADLRAIAARVGSGTLPTIADVPAHPGDPASQVAALRAALADAGLALAGVDLQPAELVELAGAWIDEQAAGRARLDAIDVEMAELAAELTESRTARGQLHEGSPAGPAVESRWPQFVSGSAEASTPASAAPPPGWGLPPAAPLAASPEAAARAAAQLADARNAVAAAERRVDNNRTAVERIAPLEQQLTAEGAAERAAAEALRKAELELEQARAAAGGDPTPPSGALEAALAEARAAEEQLAARLAQADVPVGDGRLVADHEARVAEAKAAEAAAVADVTAAEQALAEAEATLSKAIEADRAEALTREPSSDDELVEEIEWYLLARLAAQRAVSAAGSVPLVLDDPFRSLEPGAGVRLLGRLERMASTVQVVVLSDAPDLDAWARELGPERVALLDASVA